MQKFYYACHYEPTVKKNIYLFRVQIKGIKRSLESDRNFVSRQ